MMEVELVIGGPLSKLPTFPS